MRKRALEEAERWMLERIGEGSDGLATVFPAMLNCADRVARAGLFRRTHPIYQKAAKDFAGLFVDDPEDFRIQPCLSPVWDTAINVISLAESGLPGRSSGFAESRRLAGREGSSHSRRLDDEQSASRSERMGLRIQQYLLSRHGRHRDGADGVASRAAGRSATRSTQLFERALNGN